MIEKSFFELAKFHPKQMEAWQAVQDYDYVLYGGAAGGGKSYWLRWMAINRLLQFAQRGLRNVRVGLFCETYTALNDRHISRIPYEFPPWLGTWSATRNEFRLQQIYGGGIIAFRNLDDVSKYLSVEFADIYVDELTMNPRETFEFLTGSRMRWPGVTDNKFLAASNPGQIGHGWVKKLWIDQDFEEETFDANRFLYVKALYTDNPMIDQAQYGRQLDTLPDNLRRAYKEADWDIFAGQFFTEFRREVHVMEPWDDEQTWKWFNALPTYCGLDYGYNAPSAVLWGKIVDDTWYIYRELYQSGLTFEELRDKITEIEEPYIIYADPSIWAKKDSPTSGAKKMVPLLLRPAFNDRDIGWVILKQNLKVNKIKIFSTCKNLIRTIPIQVHNERAESKAEDLDTHGEDHLVDALRYLIATHKIKKPIKDFTFASNGSNIRKKHKMGDLDELFVQKKRSPYAPKLPRTSTNLPRSQQPRF